MKVIQSKPWLDKLLGGGVHAPSVMLIGGMPGGGKTTFALQFIRDAKIKALYVASAGTFPSTKYTMSRINLSETGGILFSAEGANILKLLRDPPDVELIVVDSLYGLSSKAMLEVVEAAKVTAARLEIPVFIVVNMNKEGDIVGPLALQSRADTILTVYADINIGNREISVWKNTFGPTVGVKSSTGEELGRCSVAMTESGFTERPPKKPKTSDLHVEKTGG